jgi:hypothetical protein
MVTFQVRFSTRFKPRGTFWKKLVHEKKLSPCQFWGLGKFVKNVFEKYSKSKKFRRGQTFFHAPIFCHNLSLGVQRVENVS